MVRWYFVTKCIHTKVMPLFLKWVTHSLFFSCPISSASIMISFVSALWLWMLDCQFLTTCMHLLVKLDYILSYRKSNMGVYATRDGLMRWVTTLLGSRVAVYKTSISICRIITRPLFRANVVLLIYAPNAIYVV